MNIKEIIEEQIEKSKSVEFSSPQGKAAFVRNLAKSLENAKTDSYTNVISTRRNKKNVVHPIKNKKTNDSNATVATEATSAKGDTILQKQIAKRNKEVKEW